MYRQQPSVGGIGPRHAADSQLVLPHENLFSYALIAEFRPDSKM